MCRSKCDNSSNPRGNTRGKQTDQKKRKGTTTEAANKADQTKPSNIGIKRRRQYSRTKKVVFMSGFPPVSFRSLSLLFILRLAQSVPHCRPGKHDLLQSFFLYIYVEYEDLILHVICCAVCVSSSSDGDYSQLLDVPPLCCSGCRIG